MGEVIVELDQILVIFILARFRQAGIAKIYQKLVILCFNQGYR